MTIWLFNIVGGICSLITLIFTFSEMNTNSFGVVWTVLLVLVGQNILEIMCYLFVLFFTYNLLKEFEAAAPAPVTLKSFLNETYEPIHQL